MNAQKSEGRESVFTITSDDWRRMFANAPKVTNDVKCQIRSADSKQGIKK